MTINKLAIRQLIRCSISERWYCSILKIIVWGLVLQSLDHFMQALDKVDKGWPLSRRLKPTQEHCFIPEMCKTKQNNIV